MLLQENTGLFDSLWATLTEQFGPAGPFYAIAGVGIMLALVAAPLLLRRQKDPVDRLNFRDENLKDAIVNLREADDGRLSRLAPYLEPGTAEEMSEIRKQLRAAGYRSPSAVRTYYFARAIGGLIGLGVGLFVFVIVPEEPKIVFAFTLSGLMALMGYFVPIYWVKRSIAVRQQDISNAFPDAMDMMLVCIEGGQSLDQAMQRVGDEMKISSGPLAEELQTVSQEFRAGKDRITVLRDFAERCNVNDISAFVTVLIQSTTFGTSIAQALRVYASEMRDKRLMRAEEKANILPTKLTLGTMMFTVPPLILILIGPSLIQIVRSLSGLSR